MLECVRVDFLCIMYGFLWSFRKAQCVVVLHVCTVHIFTSEFDVNVHSVSKCKSVCICSLSRSVLTWSEAPVTDRVREE